MNRDQLVQQLMATFLDELHVHVSSLGRDLLALENNLSADEKAEAWTSIFRAAHSLKGASAVVHVEPIHVACHRLEDIFEYYRDSDQTLSQETTSILLKVVDAIEEIGMRIRAEQGIEDAPLTDMLPQLERLAEQVTGSDAATTDVAPANTAARDAVVADSVDEDDDMFDDDEEFEFDESPPNREAEPQETERDAAPKMPPINAALLPVFLEELEDRCASLSRDAIAMESVTDPDERGELLTSLFRSAHSLKGAAGVVKLVPVQALCHRLEDELESIRAGTTEYSTGTATAMLEAVDVIRDSGNQLQSGRELDLGEIESRTSRIDELLSGSAEPAAAVERSTPDADAAQTKPASPKPASPKPASPKPASPKPVVEATPAPVAFQPPAEVGSGEKTDGKTPPTKRVKADSGASIRVPAEKLDALLSHSGELLVARGRLAFRAKDAAAVRDMAAELRGTWRENEQVMRDLGERTFDDRDVTNPRRIAAVIEHTASRLNALSSRLDALASAIESDNRLLQQTCGLLDDEVYNVRMLPFSDACGGLQRAVRDIATGGNKKIDLKIVGAEVEVDRSVLEGLKDPLLHLVRNSADHGVESPAQRKETGKPERATITVSAELRGGQVQVRVEDDGGGLDLRRICEIARKRDIEVPDDPREQARLIFAPGFSTAKLITDISGRGVGLDVVQSQVESLHGSVDVSFKPGRGTRFTLNVPLTLTTIRSMMVKVADQTYAIPTSAIQRLVRFSPADLRSSAGRDSLLLGEAPMVVASLAQTLRLPSKGPLPGSAAKGLAIVLHVADQSVAVVVDEVLSEQEVLVKNLGSRVRRLRHFSGCTLLPTGKIALVINAANVVRTALGLKLDQLAASRTSMSSGKQSVAGPETHGRTLLLAEDSVTTRVLLRNILESAGYEVTTAADGQQAWELIQEKTFDILVTDVDMPRMDGFELTAALRGLESAADLPVVLVTARGSDADKQRGVQAGANAYIVKGNFEQQHLLETVAQLI
ncbi:hybrid sensor histidine kinase/response regulator [Stieleria sp. ICT_E10.1]|uniref:hybrid sensor histidine kinase/response regulator n=1 Tax=Stieleria sedimenti TaxID=2976331 RepID=UPI002180837D|nr:hybrid sensor histidine kinase/response regulator [Stieleria sedimenti]MCS7470932.1 hybrid sensor histidine kinase/response regulator [Stieleria sedimenti]